MSSFRDVVESYHAQACAEFVKELRSLVNKHANSEVLNLDIVKALLFKEVASLYVAHACISKIDKECE